MDLDVAYVNTRMRSMKAKLFTKSDYEIAAKSKDLRELTAFLEQKGYRLNLDGAKAYTREEINRRLGGIFIAELDRLRLLAPASLKEVFDALRDRYEAEDIKTVISMKASGHAGDIMEKLPFPPKDEKLMARLAESDMGGIVKILSGKGYELEGPYRVFRDSGSAQSMLIAIEKKPLMRLGSAVEKQGEEARGLVGGEMDLLNFLNSMRVKEYGAPNGISLLPSYRIDTSGMRGDNQFERFMNIASKKQPFKRFSDKKPADAEVEMRRYIIDRYRRAIVADPTETAPVLGYVRAKEQEVRNLMTICNLLQRMDGADIEELLY